MTGAFRGIFTPLVTPITESQSPDLPSLARLVESQIRGGVHGLWVMGTTAEFASFTRDERAAALETVIETVSGRVPVIVNISDASTRAAIELGRHAVSAGATAVAATPPYYYPHSQDELLVHYRTIRHHVDLPLFLYNIPQTVRVRIELATARALAEDGTASGIKDSQNDLEWFRQLAQHVRRENLQFSAFAGTRYLIDAAMAVGAVGAIPSIANLLPSLCVRVYDAAFAGDSREASLCEAQIIDTEQIAALASGGSANAKILGFLKTALQAEGVIEISELTLPLRSPITAERDEMVRRLEALRETWSVSQR